MYIFDEPSAGLHPNDNEHVLKKLRQLQVQGNSVILIEHDPISILSADHIVELGPGAGINGGEIVFSGDAKSFKKTNKKLLDFKITETDFVESKEFLQIKSGNINNLNNFELKIPLQRNICIAGVSGAGKSSLVQGLIVKTIDIEKRGANNKWKSKFAELQSSISIDRLLIVDQSPIGRNSRSTPASYLNIWDEIRKLFAKTIEARTQGWNSGYFSYNGGKGACPNCKGLGEIKLDISFLNEARVECEVCRGQRYREETLRARYSGLSIKDVLDLNFEQAKSFFANHKKIHQTIHQACALGLSYLTLGQAAPTLSGGESQRLKLVLELAKIPREHTLYIFDEPSRGLHREDVKLLIEVFRRLRDQGHSVLVIEHDADIIRSADYLIELGPKAGIEGGKVVYQGHPSQIKKSTAWGELLSNLSV
jgi:excinuclease ABC subunit A